jgi:hypothetical protein
MRDYYNLGTYSRPVTTNSSRAQLWFDRGLLWCYGYNHEEAVRCFRTATARDNGCAMAYWGIAYASGSNYNKRWEAFAAEELREALAVARQATEAALVCLDRATPVERALIRALEQRYQSAQEQLYRRTLCLERCLCSVHAWCLRRFSHRSRCLCVVCRSHD